MIFFFFVPKRTIGNSIHLTKTLIDLAEKGRFNKLLGKSALILCKWLLENQKSSTALEPDEHLPGGPAFLDLPAE